MIMYSYIHTYRKEGKKARSKQVKKEGKEYE